MVGGSNAQMISVMWVNLTASLSRLRLIATREFLSYLRTPGFWLSMMIGPIAAGFGATAPTMMHQAAPAPVLTVIDLSATGATPMIAAALGGQKPLAILVARRGGRGDQRHKRRMGVATLSRRRSPSRRSKARCGGHP